MGGVVVIVGFGVLEEFEAEEFEAEEFEVVEEWMWFED